MSNRTYISRVHSGARISVFASTFFGAALPLSIHAQTYVTPVEEAGGVELVLEDSSSITVSTAIPNSITALTSRNPGSRVLAEGLSVNTVNAIGVQGRDGGRIDLTNGGEINVDGAFSSAVTAGGAGTEVNISGSSAVNQFRINTSGSSVGMMITDDAHINLDHVSVSVNDDGLYGALASSLTGKAYLTASNSVFTMDSPDSVALRADSNAVMNVSDSQIITSEQVGVGIYALHGAEVNLTGNSSINTAGPSSVGVFVSAQGAEPTVVNLIAGTGNQIQINTAGFIGFGVYAQGANSFANLDGVSINTTGPNAAAVRADDGATVTLNQGRVITSGMQSYGLNANDIGTHIDARDMDISTSADLTSGIILQDGGRVSLSGNSSIATSGDGASGVGVSTLGADPTVANLVAGMGGQIQISTVGEASYGILAERLGSAVNLEGFSINTSGFAAGAVRADDGAAVALSQGDVATSGSFGIGLMSIGSGTHIEARNTDISTTGENADGILLQDGGRVSLTGSVVKAGGAGATGAYLIGGGEILDLYGSQLTSAQSYGIYSLGSGAEINLIASAITGATGAVYADASGGAGDAVLLSASQNARVDGDIFAAMEFSGNFSGSTLNGHVVALSPSTLTDNIVLNFTDGSSMTGSVSGVSHAGFTDSTWVMTDSSTLTGLSSSAGGLSLSNGQVIFAAQGANYKTLTASALDGNGAFELNASLNQGGSSTQSDLIHVIGSASGDYQLGINNTDGSGARTLGDGIRVVQLDDASNSASFALRRPVVAGAYEYFLYQGGEADANDWYLRSALVASNSGGEPAYNPSVVGYSAGSYVNRMYGFDTIGTLHQRMGDQAASSEYGASQGSWARVGGGERKLQPGRFSYDTDTWFAQFGSDLYQADNADGSSTRAGVMATLGQTNVNAGDSLRSQRTGLNDHTGSMTAKAYGAGAYFTHYLEDNSYVDVVGQLTHYSNDYSSIYRNKASQSANGMTLSVEAGKPFKHDSGWYVEPQVQVMYQHLRSSDLDDETVIVKGESDSTGLVRLGARVGYDGATTSNVRPYLSANVLSSIGSAPKVDVGGVKIHNDYSQQWAEVGGGVSGEVAKNISIYADLHYQRAFDGDMHGIGGSVGVRMDW
jgi:outer membrane autotransporter protein